MYKKYIKRLLDIILSLIALIVLSPIILIAAILVRIKLGSPVIFKQERPGKDEKIFKMYKFRTMTNERDENGELLPDEVRLTKFGQFLRSASLDELPELINIFKADMSIVGPRPLSTLYLPYYDEKEKHRHDVRPGLTGLAQVNGRNALSWEERFIFDLQYINNITFVLDCKIIFKTVMKVIKRSDTSLLDQSTESFHVIRAKQLEKAMQTAEIPQAVYTVELIENIKEIDLIVDREAN
jgi:lipopolysaccharide/colanic/teichoic acid biosynthesis glycosyltransferase